MATFDIPVTCSNITGSTNFKVKYRLMGDSVWTSFLIPPTSGSVITIPQNSPVSVLPNNRIYDFQIQNLNGADNPLSLISQSIGITDPNPLISPTATTAGYSFNNLSVDIDSYTIDITTVAEPGTVIQTNILTPTTFPETLSDTFINLLPLTGYRLIITPVANQFSTPFVHLFDTGTSSNCPEVTNVIATLTP
jgi:hypothetical protein